MRIADYNDIIGNKYNQLTVLEYIGKRKSVAYYKCKCDCGNTTEVARHRLLSGHTKTCGHYNKNRPDLNPGDKFGELTVLEFDHQEGTHHKYYKCQCSCGKIISVRKSNLITGHTKSCGHLFHARTAEDLTGKRFGRLLVLEELRPEKDNGEYYVKYRCKCDCGNETVVWRSSLLSGETRSCGCYMVEARNERNKYIGTTHGMSKTRIYNIYQKMIDRCYNSKNEEYYRYGGRGIRVCDRWLEKFENFFEDMGDEYEEKSKIYGGEKNISIDRRNNDGNYDPLNCHWANNKQQNYNRSDTVRIQLGRDNMKLIDAFEIYANPNLNYIQVYSRIFRYNWTPEEALSIPPLYNISIQQVRDANLFPIMSYNYPISFFDPNNPPEDYLEAKRILEERNK